VTSQVQFLTGRIALVTGANRGIGRAISETFVRHGATVLINARGAESAAQVASQLTAIGPGAAHPLPFDVRHADAVKAAFLEINKTHKRLDIVVNNAGILRDALIGMAGGDLIEETLDTNLVGVILCCQYAARLMSRQKSGSIINMSSIIGRVGNEGQSVYAASKAAVIGLTQSLAKELGPAGVRVNAVAPGFIDTDMIRNVPPEKAERIRSNIKMGRLGTPQDVANVALFLASDLSSYVTGQVIGVDGGMIV
jgi:3-oxoacyl-[acyl-carrier protein] reductase